MLSINTYTPNCTECKADKEGWCTFHLARHSHELGLCSSEWACFFCPPTPWDIDTSLHLKRPRTSQEPHAP